MTRRSALAGRWAAEPYDCVNPLAPAYKAQAVEFGCALPGDTDLLGDRVEPAEVCSVRSLRRIGPDKAVAFDLAAEIVQRRWLSVPGRPPVEFLGGATAIIGADGRFRYVIRKSVTDPRRAAAHCAQAVAGLSYEARSGRLLLRQASLRELHRQRVATGGASPQGTAGRGGWRNADEQQ